MTPRRDREILVPIALYAESVSTLRNLASKYSGLNDEQLDWLELLTLDWPLLADLALAATRRTG